MRMRSLTKWVFAGNVAMFLLLGAMVLSGFSRQQPAVLTVERLNIVDSDGKPALVLSNGRRLPGAVFKGKEYPQDFVGRGRSAGMIFFNEEGDEVGGLIYEGARKDSLYRAFGHLSFDQWEQNQVVAVQYQDDGRSRSAGVRVWDRPTDAPLEEQFSSAVQVRAAPPGPLRDSLRRVNAAARARVQGSPRLFLGSEDRVAKLELLDQRGRVRVRLLVDSLGAGRLVFLDSLGRATTMYPE